MGVERRLKGLSGRKMASVELRTPREAIPFHSNP